MRLSALTHLVAAVRALAQCESVIVLGSAALLGTSAALGEPGGPLETTRDADLLLTPVDAEMAAVLHEALGEGSLFDARYGYHVDLLRPEIVATLPAGWQSRLVPVAGASAVSAFDVAFAKLFVGRDKDLAVVTALLAQGLVRSAALAEAIMAAPAAERDRHAAMRRLQQCGTLEG